MQSSEQRQKLVADWARGALNFDQLVDVFAAHIVEYMDLKALVLELSQIAQRQSDLVRKLSGDAKDAGLKAKLLRNIAQSEQHLQKFVAAGVAHAQKTAAVAASARGKAAADTLHSRPGGPRQKAAEIRQIWASGRYSSRDVCAEQECAALGMSFSSARKALRNTPDPV